MKWGIKMDTDNVFVIIGNGFKKIDVIREIKDEGYNHNFYFADSDNFSEMIKQLNISDETWCFGDCDGLAIYKYADRNGIDFWRMG